MYLVAAWVFPAHEKVTGDRVAHAVDRRLPDTSVAHVWLYEHDGWWVVGVFVNGSPSGEPDRDVERVRLAVASIMPDEQTTILAELLPLAPIIIAAINDGIDFPDDS